MSKKIFSKEKFQQWLISVGHENEIKDHDWADDCEGLTEEEMETIGFGTCEPWMIEVTRG